MRSDMYKVIVERPRLRGSRRMPHKGRLTQKLDRDFETGRHNESMKFRWRLEPKVLNENLNPLYRFIRSQAGRPWDDVYSEICEHISVNSTVQQHVRDHVDMFVELHVIMINNLPHVLSPYHGYRELSDDDMYVHPDTGILCRVMPRRRRRYIYKPLFQQVKFGRMDKYVEIDDIWYFVTFDALPDNGSVAFDVVLRQWTDSMSRWEIIREWGAPVFATSKRQANKREIRQHIRPKLEAPDAR